MKALLLTAFSTFNIFLVAMANTDCIYIAKRKGITIQFVSSCDFEINQRYIDSFANKVAQRLKLDARKRKYKILVLVNLDHIYYDFSGPNYFTSVGIDTLRRLDSGFITDHGYDNYSTSDQSRIHPLDINATDKRSSDAVGIKIIFNRDYRDTLDWSQIESLIIYAARNEREIEISQHIDTVRHDSWYITLPTIDTNIINRVLGIHHKPEVAEIQPAQPTSYFWKKSVLIIWAILIVVVLSVLIILRFFRN